MFSCWLCGWINKRHKIIIRILSPRGLNYRWLLHFTQGSDHLGSQNIIVSPWWYFKLLFSLKTKKVQGLKKYRKEKKKALASILPITIMLLTFLRLSYNHHLVSLKFLMSFKKRSRCLHFCIYGPITIKNEDNPHFQVQAYFSHSVIWKYSPCQ